MSGTQNSPTTLVHNDFSSQLNRFNSDIIEDGKHRRSNSAERETMAASTIGFKKRKEQRKRTVR